MAEDCSMLTIPELKKDFTDSLNSLSRSRHPSSTFSSFLEIVAICLHQLPYEHGDFPKSDDAYQRMEAKYFEAIKGYSADELTTMAHMMSITLLAHKTEFGDFLGELAGENELLSQRGGQFFTPYPVCSLMAQINLVDASKIVEEKGLITISDPAVGGGAMLIASAEALLQQQIDPRSCAQFDAIDISRNSFNMAYIQLSALDLQAMVRHGNTLSMEIWENRPTPQLRYFEQELRQRQAIEQMRQFIMNPNVLLADEAEEPTAEITDATSDTSAPVDQEEGELASSSQQSLLTSQEFSGMTSEADAPTNAPGRKADIVFPVERQLGLFSNENDG